MPITFTNPGVRCGLLDINNLTAEEKVVSDALAWIKFDVDEKLYLYTLPDELTPRPHALITFSEGCFASVCTSELNTMRGLQWFFRNLFLTNADINNQPQNPSTTNKNPQNPQAAVFDIQTLASGSLGSAAGALDGASLNNFDYQPAAVYPIAGAIPMRSNIVCYGPWASSNFSLNHTPDNGSCGGINIENNPDLNPWNYGSTLAMQGVGQSLVENTAIGLIRSETGSVTVPGLPSGITTVGGSIGTYGPPLSSINFSYGSQGISTSYEFKTYTPKFGKLNKLFIDKFKENVKKRAEFLRFIKNQSVTQYKSFRRIKAVQNQARLQALRYKQAASRQASLQRVLVGEMYNLYAPKEGSEGGPSQRTVVGIDTLDKSINEMVYDFDKKAFISLDAIYSPVSISGSTSGIFPRFVTADTGVKHFSSPIHAQPPFSSGECDTSSISRHNINNIKIHNMYLNPLANPNSIPHVSGGSGHMGHFIDLVGRESGIPDSGLMSSLYPRDSSGRYSDDYRFLGMKGPLVLHSWGYDVDGKPIPNFIDSEDKAKSGIFIVENTGNPAKPSGLTEMFMTDWLHKPATWPVGPVDLRFDRERGVWVSPQPYKIVVAKITDSVSAFGSGVGTIINEYKSKQYGKDLYDGSGNPIRSSGCVASGVNDEEECYDDWILTHMGQPECPDGEDTLDVVTRVELKKGGLYAIRKRIKIPGVSIVEDISSCIIAGTECEDQAGGDNAYYLAEACYSSTTPGYVYISYPDEEGNFSNGNVIQNNSSDSCYTITGLLNPGDSFPTNPVYEDGGAQGDWSLVNNCSTQSCLPDSFYYGERCDSENSIERIKITREGETTAFSNGDVLSNETYGCFTITLIVPEDLSPGSDATDLPHKSGGNISEWTEVSGCDYNSCSGPVYMENCCSTESPAYIKITEYDIKPEVGEIYKIESSNISSGCFKVITSEPCEYVVSEGGVQLTTQESCEVCLSGLQIDCEVESSGNGPLIKIVDRIGNSYNVNEYIYAYYDTYNSEYLVLGRGGDGGNITAFGTITKINSGFAWLSVEKVTGGDIDLIGRTIKVSNSAGYSILEGCTAKGFASKFISAS